MNTPITYTTNTGHSKAETTFRVEACNTVLVSDSLSAWYEEHKRVFEYLNRHALVFKGSSTASLCWICAQVPIFTFVGGFFLSKCSFSIGFFKSSHIVSEFYLNSLWVQQSYGNQSECWNVQPSCSSTMLSALRHGWGMLALCCGEIECYFLKLDSQPTLVLL